MARRIPKLLDVLVAEPPAGWRFGAASFLSFDAVTLDGIDWTVTRALHVANGFQTAWDLHPRDPVAVDVRDRLVSGAFHTLFHAFEKAGYETRILDAPPALLLGFHRPQRTAREALGEFGSLAGASVATILGGRRIPGIGRRQARSSSYLAPERCVRAVRELAADEAFSGALLTLNALCEVPGEDGWFLLGHATAARGKTTLGAVLTRDPGAPELSEEKQLPAAKRRKIAAAFRKQGFQRGDDGWFSRTVTAGELVPALGWLAEGEVVRG